jgi:hypothetical protein
MYPIYLIYCIYLIYTPHPADYINAPSILHRRLSPFG